MRASGDDALFARLKASFSDQEIIELTMAAAVWNMTNRLNEALHTQLEQHLGTLPTVTRVSRDALLEYVRKVTESQRPPRDGFQRVHRWDLDWEDDTDLLSLGQGVQVKVLRRDPETQHADMLIKFPPGYVEPRHAHDSVHSVIVLEGLQIAEGEHMHPGDYVFGGGATPHGPFEYPEGCVVFASFRGPSPQHRYEGSPAGDI